MATKRSDGEGSITKRKDGRWQGCIMLDRKRYYIYGKTRAEVVEGLRELKRQHTRGTDLSKKALTVEATSSSGMPMWWCRTSDRIPPIGMMNSSRSTSSHDWAITGCRS
jgi:hypothetical protein